MNSLVSKIPGENDCYFVQSRSRPEILHRLEVVGGEVSCSCEQAFAKGDKECRHVLILRGYLCAMMNVREYIEVMWRYRQDDNAGHSGSISMTSFLSGRYEECRLIRDHFS